MNVIDFTRKNLVESFCICVSLYKKKHRLQSSSLVFIASISESSKTSKIALTSSSFFVFSDSTAWRISSNTLLLSSTLDFVFVFVFELSSINMILNGKFWNLVKSSAASYTCLETNFQFRFDILCNHSYRLCTWKVMGLPHHFPHWNSHI